MSFEIAIPKEAGSEILRIEKGASVVIVGANGSVGKSCVNNLKDDNDLVLISRSEFDSDVEGNFEKNVLDINDYTNTESFIQSINCH